MTARVITWNLFHGRTALPGTEAAARPGWLGALKQLLRGDGADCRAAFTALLVGARWDAALLQECPPRWARHLAEACGAEFQMAPTSRNSLAPVRGWIAERSPDLIASNEGGCNLTLVRPSLGGIGLRRELVIRRPPPGLRRGPERRVMAFAECGAGLCLANLHATNDRPALATEEVLDAAERATTWAGSRPLIFGGDLNLRPAEAAPRGRGGTEYAGAASQHRGRDVFTDLEGLYGLRGPTGPFAIDHLLARGLEVSEAPARWPDRARLVDPGAAVSGAGERLLLSDHAPVEALFTWN